MQSNRDHGPGAIPRKKRKGDGHLRSAVPRDHSAASKHHVIIDLVRLLAREAAAEWLVGEKATLVSPENSDDQDQGH